MQKIDHLIITSPYEEPRKHWWYDESKKSFDQVEGRRLAGYIIASQADESSDDPGIFVELPLVNRIRPRVKAWREGKNGSGIPYAGATSITKRLLEHWHDQSERDKKFFFCQLDAMETLIWLAEAPAADKLGIDVSSDGGPFRRYCSKMATGSGKTIVMAMLIAWQVLNKAAAPERRMPEERPDTLNSITDKIKTGFGNLYVTITFFNQKPFEVFASIGKSGYSTMADAEAIGRLIILALRTGVDPKEVVSQIAGIGGSDPVFTEGGLVTSIPDAIAKVLGRHFGTMKNGGSKDMFQFVCRQCGATRPDEKCPTCPNCGWNKCS